MSETEKRASEEVEKAMTEADEPEQSSGFRPLTAEALEQQIARAQWQVEIAVVKQLMAEEQRRLADAVVPLSAGIAPATQHGSLKNTIRQCEERIAKLKLVLLTLGTEEAVPLPSPSALVVPTMVSVDGRRA